MASRSRSLRFKLTLWYVLVFSLIQMVLLGAVVLSRRSDIRRGLDDDLETAASKTIEDILTAGGEPADVDLAALIPAVAGFTLGALRTADGRVAATWNVRADDLLPLPDPEVHPTGPVGPVFTTLDREQALALAQTDAPLRLVTVPFRRGSELYSLQLAVPDRIGALLLKDFLDLALVAVPVGSLAALLASWVIARRAVTPIHRLSRAVQEIAPSSLGEPLRVRTTDSEIARLENELDSALQRVQEAFKAQEQVIGNVSHEIKTPIAVLVTEAQVAKLGQRNLDKSYAFIDKAERELKRLASLVESFLSLARMDMNKNRPPNVVLVDDVVRHCVQHCKEIADQNRVHVRANLARPEASPDPFVSGDPALLQVMVDNLIRNAIRHSPRDAAVDVDVQTPDDVVQIAVRDRGPGIPDEYLTKVFERGVRLQEEGSSGTGLGLSIAHNVAQFHGGDIAARKNEAGGCSFVVTLPLARRGSR